MNYRPPKIVDDTSRVCCFSGHRPNKLVGNGDTVNSLGLRRILSVLMLSIQEAVQEGYDTFLSGMAQGIDMWAAGFVNELRRQNKDLKLICVIPYRGQESRYSPEERFDYNLLLSGAHKVVYLSDEYTKESYRNRNACMVENSSKLIAVVSDYRSGTGQTINLARRKGIDTRIIDVTKNEFIFSDDNGGSVF